MRLTKGLGNLLLAIWLILFGVTGFVSSSVLDIIVVILAIITGVVLLFGR